MTAVAPPPRNGGVSHWYAAAGLPGRRPPLQGDRDADVCIVGGGLTGLWSAYYLKRARPGLRIAVLEREFAGFGASGRNGGWLSSEFNGSRERMARTHGAEAVVALARAMQTTIDEVLDVCAREGIECDQIKHGLMHVARSPAQLARARAGLPDQRRWLPDPDALEELDADGLAQRVRVAGALGATWSPHCARVQPAKLVRGLAEVVERMGVDVLEGTTVTEVRPGAAVTERGTVRAPHVLVCLEGFTAGLRGLKRAWLPLNSAMVVTEPLPDAVWDEIGWAGAELVGDTAHAYMYAQRTADGRIALGGRGIPYRFGSRTDHDGQTQRWTADQLTALLRDMFPAAAQVPIAHTWCGVLGVPRDWQPAIRLDRATGIGMAGGYVGSGLSTTNLAGRTLCDLVLGEESDVTRLPWVGHDSRRWEPEPLRWLGSRVVYGLYRAADRRESESGEPRTDPLARVADLVSGRG